ncbi:hypothetical protein DYB25_012456 [Aphanomyces astaci]|uniref:6-phosphofructo-2-kinase domain-containing protein n=1 Tax=Aphanomyces astaci TaxID=112090 RepID=A0A397BYX8_APHAT|nr:hypothetical protein DYB25_012456 [Aphanomyces astaci]
MSLWYSTAKCARQTAAVVPSDVRVQWRALRGLEAGMYNALTKTEFQLHHPTYRYPLGESYMDVLSRLEPVIFELERSRAPVVIVAHVEVLRCLYAYFLDLPILDIPNVHAPLNEVIELHTTAYECLERRHVFEPLADGPGKGRVVIYSIPSSILEETAGVVNSSIVMQIQEAGNDIRLFSTVRWKASPTCRTRDFGQEPDASLTPVGLTIGASVLAAGPDFPYPNVIVEVAYKNDSLERLRTKLDRWMSDTTSVQVAIGIKIDAASPSRVAILLQRGQPVMPPVKFGHPEPGPLQISFPLASVYAGVALPPALAGLGNTPISIDLIQLRTVMDEAIGQELPAAQ